MTIDAHEYHLNMSILEYVKQRFKENDMIKSKQQMAEELDYAIKSYKADRVLLQNPSSNIKLWSKSSDIKTYLEPFKMKQSDEA